jgi:tol-pal system protein YbgF
VAKAQQVYGVVVRALKSLNLTAFEDEIRRQKGMRGGACVQWSKPMKSFLKSTVTAVLIMGLAGAYAGGVRAEDDDDDQLASRVDQMEAQMRQLMGQVEELTYEVKQLRGEMSGQRKTGEYVPAPQKKQKVAAQDGAPAQGIEQIDDGTTYEEQPMTTTVLDENGNEVQVPIRKAPGPKILGTLSGSNYPEGDGGFQGQVLVPPTNKGGTQQPAGGYDSGGQVLVAPADSSGGDNSLVPEKVETAALGGAATDDPEVVYERSYESLLRRQFTDAEVGFRGFLDRHRDHSLAGNAQYWLGETYYVQGDYKQAAQAFLSGYRDFPKSRKAADSLLKLGLSLNRLGQKEQACAAFSQVGSQFPKAAEARKRAQVEIKRGGCV